MQVSLSSMQSLGAFNGALPGAALYAGVSGLDRGLGQSCPEGSRRVDRECECYSGRVWMPDGSRCVSPQSPAYQGAMNIQEVWEAGGGSSETYAQQNLSASARRYIESKGHTIHCEITEDWFHGPQGGSPPMLCSVDGGPYEHGAYAINLNPDLALLAAARTQAAETVSQATGIAPGSISSTVMGEEQLQKITDKIYRGEATSETDVAVAPVLHEMAKKEAANRKADAEFAEQIQQGGSTRYHTQGQYDDAGTGSFESDTESLPNWAIPAAAAAAVLAFMG